MRVVLYNEKNGKYKRSNGQKRKTGRGGESGRDHCRNGPEARVHPKWDVAPGCLKEGPEPIIVHRQPVSDILTVFPKIDDCFMLRNTNMGRKFERQKNESTSIYFSVPMLTRRFTSR